MSGRPLERVLVVGARGQLGRAAVELLGEKAVPLSHEQMDISDPRAVATALDTFAPSHVMNCGAATDVDRCELDHSYADSSNWQGPGNLAELARERRIGLIHVSTDFVFDGSKTGPYFETDDPNPLNYYGLSKLRGEEVVRAHPDVLIVRTSWLYGAGGVNFPAKVLQWAAGGGPLKVAADQWGSPTYAADLAAGILALAERGLSGIFHLAGSGCASRLELAQEVLGAAHLNVLVEPASAREFAAAAPRPIQTCLDCSKALSAGVALSPWREAVSRFIAEEER